MIKNEKIKKIKKKIATRFGTCYIAPVSNKEFLEI